MYVDKTCEIFSLIDSLEGQFFLARPRRMGKSLTLSTLKAVFEGKKELFKDLYIYNTPYNWAKHPIIHLSMNRYGNKSCERLDEDLGIALDYIAEKHSIVLKTKHAYQKFQELITKLNDSDKKVVILIDEYDKPILDNILNKHEIENLRGFLKGFYGIIKAQEDKIRFTFITGVSKFSKVSIFSDLNNITDITMEPKYASLCGFTQQECEHYFADYIEENAQKLNLSKAEYLQKLKDTYNGIRFTEKNQPVYNPVSFTNKHPNSKT